MFPVEAEKASYGETKGLRHVCTHPGTEQHLICKSLVTLIDVWHYKDSAIVNVSVKKKYGIFNADF